ncbi:MAG TPA: hypothetical protein VK196_21320 [Magnetospirillum sp.]|nr:hypothetical protein [Magnetospirillum sp.]
MMNSAALLWRASLQAISGRNVRALVFPLLLLAAAAPVLAGSVPPLADFVNHLARMHILAHVGSDPLLAELYRVQWTVIPNLIMDAVVPPLARAFGIYAAGQMFALVTLALLATGPMAVHRALYGRASPLPMVAFLFLYNGILLYGLMNYLLGLGIALWGLAAWIALRERSVWLRLPLAFAIVLALFFCHLFDVGLFGLAVGSLELWRWRNRRPLNLGGMLRDGVLLALPFVPVPLLMLASPTMGLSSDVLWLPQGKMDGVYSIFQLYGDVTDMVFALVLGAGAMWLTRRRLLRLHPAGWVLFVVSAAIFLAMPRVLFGSWLADQRMPIAIVFLMIGFLKPADGRTLGPAFYGVLIAACLFRFVDVQAHWLQLADRYDQFRASTASIAPGASVLVATADQPSGTETANQAVSHAPCLAVIERGALVSTIFSVPGKQILNIAPTKRDLVDAEDGDPPTVSQMLAAADGPVPGTRRYWDRWPQRYDYVYVLYTHRGDDSPDPETLLLRAEGDNFQLYQIRK